MLSKKEKIKEYTYWNYKASNCLGLITLQWGCSGSRQHNCYICKQTPEKHIIYLKTENWI